jgi:hypothetical protein
MSRKIILGFFAAMLLVLARNASAADVAFVYSNEDAIRSGRPLFGAVTSDGILAPADAVLAAGGEVFVGLPGGAVKKAKLVRLDKALNVALLSLGENILNPELQAAHRRRAVQLQALLPTQVIVDTTSFEGAPQDLGQALVSSGTPIMKITFNGGPVTKDVIHLKPWLNKVRFSVELMATNSEPVRNFSLRIHSNPTLTFANLESTIAREVKPGYDYEFKSTSAVKAGKAFKFSLEARGVSAKDYEWIIEVKADGHLQQEKVFVHFD